MVQAADKCESPILTAAPEGSSSTIAEDSSFLCNSFFKVTICALAKLSQAAKPPGQKAIQGTDTLLLHDLWPFGYVCLCSSAHPFCSGTLCLFHCRTTQGDTQISVYHWSPGPSERAKSLCSLQRMSAVTVLVFN